MTIGNPYIFNFEQKKKEVDKKGIKRKDIF